MTVAEHILEFAWHNLPHRDRLRAMPTAPKTVWLLGAGASKHYAMNALKVPMPLARDFFRALYALPTSSGLHARIGDLVAYVRMTRGVSLDSFDEDIESFMTSVEEHLAALRRRVTRKVSGEAASASAVASNMGFLFANVINEAQNGPTSPCYDELLMASGPNDVFVTLNWDTLLDRSLAASGCWEPNRGYGISFDGVYSGRWLRRVPHAGTVHSCGWTLLKLHGSTNWLTPYAGVHPQTLEPGFVVPGYERVFLYWEGMLPFRTHAARWRGGYASTCYGYYPPNAPEKYFPEADVQRRRNRRRMIVRVGSCDVGEPVFEGGVPTSPLLITPVRQKRYERYSRAIDAVWRQAREALESADRIVVVGYSFPETDTRVTELVAGAVRGSQSKKEVLVVDPHADDIVQRAFAGTAVKTVSGTMEDYLALLRAARPRDMIRLASMSSDIREWLRRLVAMVAGGMDLEASARPARSSPTSR